MCQLISQFKLQLQLNKKIKKCQNHFHNKLLKKNLWKLLLLHLKSHHKKHLLNKYQKIKLHQKNKKQLNLRFKNRMSKSQFQLNKNKLQYQCLLKPQLLRHQKSNQLKLQLLLPSNQKNKKLRFLNQFQLNKSKQLHNPKPHQVLLNHELLKKQENNSEKKKLN